jgi:polyisoprenoid-binding protein YceI
VASEWNVTRHRLTDGTPLRLTVRESLRGEISVHRRPVFKAASLSSRLALAAVLVAAIALPTPRAEERLLDTRRSLVTIRIAHEGFLGRFFSDIVMRAPLMEGSVDEAIPHMQVVFEARQLRTIDAGWSARDREAVHSQLIGPDALDVDRFTFITYHSITIEPRSADEWLIHGELELHGTIAPVMATARRQGERFRGSATVRPSAFHIAPITRWGGWVTVKDEAAVEFDVALDPR